MSATKVSKKLRRKRPLKQQNHLSTVDRSTRLTRGQRFAAIDRRYSLEHLFEPTQTSRLPTEQALRNFIEAYALRLAIDHPFLNDLKDVRLAPDTLIELAKDYCLFDFAWKLEKRWLDIQREQQLYQQWMQAQEAAGDEHRTQSSEIRLSDFVEVV